MNLGSRIILLAVLVGSATAAAAQDRSAVEREFQLWLMSEMWPLARTAGVLRATFDRTLEGITLDWDLPELEPPGAPVRRDNIEWQAEFRSPAAYFAESGLRSLVRQGRQRLSQWRTTLAEIEMRYGVPAEILVAVWGKETVFGTFPLPELAIRALATHAFMGRRADLFRAELVAALTIIENGDIAPERMLSSWAGGLGQPQFQPSTFLSHAVDLDGDGRRDIWNSVPDTLASIANFLAEKGWHAGRPVAVEAIVPADVSCALEGPDQGKSASEWARLGVTGIDGGPLPLDAGRPAFLLMPAGRYGPSFIVTENFYVLKEYNRSDLYALYVSHLADRFSDDRAFHGAWAAVEHFRRGDVRDLQERLVAAGHDVGGTDGLVGYKTRIAVGVTQRQLGQPATCLPDTGLISAVR